MNPYANAIASRRLPPEAVKTYEVARPRQTHSRPATCVEVGCAAHAHGWATLADERTEQGRLVAHQVRSTCRPVDVKLAPAMHARVRRYIETSEDGVTHFTFPPGQVCFAPHTVELERPSLYVVKDGDYRGNPRGTTPIIHKSGADWVEDSALHQATLVAEHQKG